MKIISIEQINEILPQTQCGLCSYPGCKPYASAIAEKGESIDRCPPGGVEGLIKLGELTGIDPAPYLEEMQQKQKPKMIAVIKEDQCIGCTKCIQACPVDAILGAGKQMHTVINSECSGCELCVAPCPVDCVDMLIIPSTQQTEREKKQQAQHYRQRYEFREQRLALEKKKDRDSYLKNKASTVTSTKNLSQTDKKRFIEEALARVQQKKSS